MTSPTPRTDTITALRQIISSTAGGTPHHDEHGVLDGATTNTATITARPTASGSVALTVENDDGEATLNLDGLNPDTPADETTRTALTGLVTAFIHDAPAALAGLCQGDDE